MMQRLKRWCNMLETWNYFLNFQESNVFMKLLKIVVKKVWLTLPKHLLLRLMQKYSLLLQRQANQQQLNREDHKADRLEEQMLHKSEMELHRIEAESFKMMMMALLANNKKDG
jgi:hypothetical protein